jgi:type IV pilus assembly protein PilB
MAAKRKRTYIDILIAQGVVSPDQVTDANEMAHQSGSKVQDALVHLGYATSDEIVAAVAEEHGLEAVNLKELNIPPAVVELLPESIARENVVIPLAEDSSGALTVVISDPNDMDTFDKLRFVLHRQIEPVLASSEAILEAINQHYGQTFAESADTLISEMTDTAIDFTVTDDETEADTITGEIDPDASPVVRLAHLIISEAVQLRASDIHIEPFEDRVRVRYRIDGVLIERDNIPKRLQSAVLSRFKILSRLDIAERRRTQDGRIKVTLGDKELDLRVSVIPTNHGQSVVMRILDKDNIKVGLRQLGFGDEEYKKFTSLIRRPNGIILVTGPTGSGKTTSLYAALNDLNTPTRKIITAEDPVEYYLPGINQVEIKHKIGLDFASVIRSMLRQAPNVILVGEMRDLETAQMGIQASLTGHLVFSTLHTNDAPGAITRLIDMKVPSYLVASTVIGIMGQRLVRVVCPKCKQTYRPSDSTLRDMGITPEMAAGGTFARGRGCGSCGGSGYRGRMALFELMMMTSRLREMTYSEENTIDIRKAAIEEGMSTLYKDGIRKALLGHTTLEEVARVARKTEQDT